MTLLSCQVLDYPFRLESAAGSRAAAQLAHVFDGFRLEREPPGVDVYRIEPAGEATRVCLNNEEILRAADSDSAVSFLESRVLERARCRTRHLCLHAGVVGRGPDSLLLPGPSGCGKTTLSLLLHLTLDWDLLSDELAVLRLPDAGLLPFPRTACLKRGSISLFGDPRGGLSAPGAVVQINGVACYRIPPVATRPRRVRWIVFPRFQPAAPTSIERVSSPFALRRLIAASLNFKQKAEAAMAALGDLAQHAEAYELQCGSPSGALDALKRTGALQ